MLLFHGMCETSRLLLSQVYGSMAGGLWWSVTVSMKYFLLPVSNACQLHSILWLDEAQFKYLFFSLSIYSSAISDTRVGIKYQTETAEHFYERSLSVVLPYELHRQIPKKSKKFEFPL